MKNTLLVIINLFLLSSLISQSVSTFHSNTTQKIDDAMVLDKHGNLYGSHFNGTNVYKITPSGDVSIFATGFNTPNGLAFNSIGQLYVCDMSGNKIYKLSEEGDFLDTFAITGPSGIIKSHDSDTMIFTQYSSTQHFVNKLSPDGTIIPYFSGSPLNGPVGLTYDNLSNLYIANFTDRKIFKVVDNSLIYVATVPGTNNGWLGFITYAQGTLWGTSFNSHKIYRIHQQFQDSVELYCGSSSGTVDGNVSTAKFNSPNGITSSITGDSLFISDYGTGKVRIIDFTASTANLTKPTASNIELNIYPNPVENFLNIETDKIIENITVYASSGQRLFETTEKVIDFSSFPSGIYVLTIYIDNQIYNRMFKKK